MLERVNLPDLAERFGGFAAELDWAKVLSVGEQQRIAFARVLLVEPRYAILDEATSALDVDNEDSLYQLLADSTSTLISVGHRPSILKYHPQVLEVTGNGEWRQSSAAEYGNNLDLTIARPTPRPGRCRQCATAHRTNPIAE